MHFNRSKFFQSFLMLSLFSLPNLGLGQHLSAHIDLFDQAFEDTWDKNPAQIHRENLKHLASFIAEDIDEVDQSGDNARMRPKYISPRDARATLTRALNNPVVALWQYNKYDPKDKGIGFCFGRAMFVHVELKYRNFDYDSVKKAFVVGSMSTGDADWGWHVTTIAQSWDKNGKEIWLAIDPIVGVMEVSDWYQTMLDDMSTDKKLKLYITESGKFGPSPGMYTHQGIEDPFYNQYFTDMMKWFGENYKNGSYDNFKVSEYQAPSRRTPYKKKKN